jgi:hypothetical protein
VWSKNSKSAYQQPLRSSQRRHFGLQDAHSITHTQRQWRAEQTEAEGRMDWKTFLAYSTGSVEQELLLRNECRVTENRILRKQIKGRVHLSDGGRKTLAEIGKKLGKQALEELSTIVKPVPCWPGAARWWRRSLMVPGSARRSRHGMSSSAHIRMCWWRPTSSPRRSRPGGGS